MPLLSTFIFMDFVFVQLGPKLNIQPPPTTTHQELFNGLGLSKAQEVTLPTSPPQPKDHT